MYDHRGKYLRHASGGGTFPILHLEKISNAADTTEVIVALSVDSREQVDVIVQAALDAGAKPYNEPQDHGFMYGWSFQDPDDHLWEVSYMDLSAFPSE